MRLYTRFRSGLLALGVAACTALTGASAQQAEPAALASGGGVEILWPTPVTEVWGSGDVVGTAAIPGMAYYYMDYLPLNDDLSLPEGAPWIPATIAILQPVVNGPLVTLDTTTVPDGLYALRLVVNSADGQSYFDVVSPVRVSNERFTRVTETTANRTIEALRDALTAAGIDLDAILTPPQPTATPVPPTAAPPPPVDTTPRAFPNDGLTAVNMRRCDVVDNYACAVIGALGLEGGTVTALSSNFTGWYQVVLPSGASGWVAPSVVTVTGSLTGLPYVAPPAPLPPPAAANIQLNGIAIQGSTICGIPFTALVNVANIGNAVSNGGTVTLQDVNVRTGEITATATGNYPAINPGGNYVIPITVSTTAYFNETHQLRAYVGSQQIYQAYSLGQGDCGAQPPPPTPAPPPGIDYGPTQCFIVLTNGKAVFDTPYGNVRGTLQPGAYAVNRREEALGTFWFRLDAPGFGTVWIAAAGLETQGGCGWNAQAGQHAASEARTASLSVIR